MSEYGWKVVCEASGINEEGAKEIFNIFSESDFGGHFPTVKIIAPKNIDKPVFIIEHYDKNGWVRDRDLYADYIKQDGEVVMLIMNDKVVYTGSVRNVQITKRMG